MSSRRTLFLLLAAGLAALITMMLVRSMMAPEKAAMAPPPVATTEILAAARNLPTGTIIKEMDLKWIPWAAEAVANGKYYVKGKNSAAEAVGAVLREGMSADEPLQSTRVVKLTDQGFLAAVLAPGKRAMSVTLSPSSGVAGFIFPGDRVDVILTHTFNRKDVDELTERYVSETVLTDVRVLALDQRSDNLATDPKIAQLATLEVAPKQAEKLALAVGIAGQPSGGSRASLSLVLRSLALDSEGKDGAVVTETSAGGATWDSDVSRAFPTLNGEDGLMQKVQVMRGKEKVESKFERYR